MKHYVRYILFVYVVTIGTVTLVWNHLEGDVIQNWYRTGGGNLRGASEFALFTTLFGIWVYPFSALAICLFFGQAVTETTTRARLACLGRVAVCVFFLLRFGYLGVAYFVSASD